jgi:hypothetical protein
LNNTVDNITSITFTDATNAIGVGSRFIITKQNNFAVGTLTGVITTPKIANCWTRVKSQTLSADAPSVTFSGLSGNTAVCYYLSMSISTTNTGYPALVFNSDGGSNYGYQYLRGTSTTVAGARAAEVSIRCPSTITANNFGQANAVIYAKSGYLRPMIVSAIRDVTGTTVGFVEYWNSVWSNTADELTTMTFTQSVGSFKAGSQFDLYALYT